MTKFNQSVAVVTGAGSGIGRALALQLAQAGAKVAISDIDESGLQETQQLLVSNNTVVHATLLNVSNRADMFDYALTVERELGKVNLVINNAGVGLSSGGLDSTSIEDFEWLMGVNFSGVLYGTKAFLPILERAEWGHIVNISSLFGLIGVAEQTAYNASKFAVRGMTEALRQELEMRDSHVSCTSVHPGGIKTNIARSARVGEGVTQAQRQSIDSNPARFDKAARTTPESAAKQILTAVVKNRRRLLIGTDAKIMDLVQRLFPNHYQRVFHWAVNRFAPA